MSQDPFETPAESGDGDTEHESLRPSLADPHPLMEERQRKVRHALNAKGPAEKFHDKLQTFKEALHGFRKQGRAARDDVRRLVEEFTDTSKLFVFGRDEMKSDAQHLPSNFQAFVAKDGDWVVRLYSGLTPKQYAIFLDVLGDASH